MVQADNTIRIDEDISAALINIVLGRLQRPPFKQLPGIRKPGSQPPDIPEGCVQHPVSAIQLPAAVNKKRPGQAGILLIGPRQKVMSKSHHNRLEPPFRESGFLFTQLRDVPTAGKSAQVTMEDQKQPPAAILLKGMHAAVAVTEHKWHSRMSCQSSHIIYT